MLLAYNGRVLLAYNKASIRHIMHCKRRRMHSLLGKGLSPVALPPPPPPTLLGQQRVFSPQASHEVKMHVHGLQRHLPIDVQVVHEVACGILELYKEGEGEGEGGADGEEGIDDGGEEREGGGTG